jgi:hypothetical protein
MPVLSIDVANQVGEVRDIRDASRFERDVHQSPGVNGCRVQALSGSLEKRRGCAVQRKGHVTGVASDGATDRAGSGGGTLRLGLPTPSS